MTIRVDIKAQADLAELVARMEAGEEVLLTRDGQPVAMVSAPPAETPKVGQRRLGVWDHLGLNLPDDLFIGPDPETQAAADGPIFPRDDEASA